MKNVAKLLALSAFLSSAPALAETPKWKISESSGTVNILRAGVSKIAITGGQLRPGDVVSTGRKSRAVLVRGQEYVVVSPGSRIRISEPQKSGGLFQFFNEVGNVLFRIDKKATPHFGVKTPYLAAVVKGTTFSVTVSETGTAVQVTEGAVQVSTNDGGAQHLLSPGMIGMVTQDQQFRLTITGTASKVIDSPNAPAGMKTGESDPVGDDPASEPSSEVVEIVDIAASGTEGVISSPVTDQPVSFSELTGGLVSDQPKENASVRLAMLDTGLTGSIPGNTGGANSDTPSQGILNGSNPGNETAATASGGNPPAGGGSGGNANGGGSASAGGNGNNKGSGNANGGGTANAGGGASNGGGNGNGGGSPAAGANGANGNGPANGGGNGAGNNGNGNGNGGSNGGGNGNGNNGNANGAENGGANGNGGSNGNNGNTAGASNGGGNGNGNNGNGNGNGGSNGGGNGNGNNGNANGAANGGANGNGGSNGNNGNAAGASNGGGNGAGNNGNGNGNGGSNGGGNGNGNNGNAKGATNSGGKNWDFPILRAVIEGVGNYIESKKQGGGQGN